MAKAKVNGKKGRKEENSCYFNCCHHNKDKRKIPWKDGIDKTNKSLKRDKEHIMAKDKVNKNGK